MSDISKIKVNGIDYDVKDTTYSAGTGTTITGNDNAINVNFGTTAGTACEGNDSRVVNALQTISVNGVDQPAVDNNVNIETGDAFGIDMYDGTLPIGITARGDNLEDWVIYGNNNVGKNLLDLSGLSNTTTNGVTFTVDATAGTITAVRTGTQSSVANYIITLPSTLYGKYYLSGCPDGGGLATYDIIAWDSTTNARPKDWSGTADSGTVDSSSTYVDVNYVQAHTNQIYIRVRPAATFTSLVFKPMIRAANTTPEFDPYHLGVGQLNSAGTGYELPIISKQKSKKNMLELSVDTQTINGVTFMVDKLAGTITLNGTATANTFFGFNLALNLPRNVELKLTGCPSGGGFANYRMDLRESVGTTIYPNTADEGNGATFTVTGDGCNVANIRIQNGYTCNNVIFRPMIRLSSESADFESYWTPNTTTNVYLGTSPLTEGQSLSKAQATTKDIPTYNGECIIDTSYPNKPRMEIIPTDSAINIINQLKDKAPYVHTQAADTITSMTGYAKPLSYSAIATSDTLNEAIGKLEACIGDINTILEEVL